MTYDLHPLCTLFPRLTGTEFDSLCADIRAHGLQQPIVLHDGMVLDGGNRYRACLETGVEPVFTNHNGGDPISFVLSVNFHRRHLSAGQQAAVVAAAQDWRKAQTHGGNRKQDQGATVAPCFDTAADRAKAANASLRTQRMADKVAKADPELAKQVAHGILSLPQALAAVSTPKKAPPSPPERPAAPGALTAEEMAEASDDFDPLVELETLQNQVTDLLAQLATVQADDPGAESLKWRQQAQQACRSRDEAMQASQQSQERERFAMKQLRRCGAAVGEEDPRAIPLAVEKLAARVKAEAS